jgi:hypothetical protein
VPARSGKRSLVARPVRVRFSLSSDGVALPSTQTPPARCAPKNGHVARVIAHALLLLEAGVVLFVDHDERQGAHGAKSALRAPMATSTFALAQPAPHRVSLARRQPRVQHGDVVAEARAEAGDELRRQRDLGDEDDGAAMPKARAAAMPRR